jgi:hypothetical protein
MNKTTDSFLSKKNEQTPTFRRNNQIIDSLIEDHISLKRGRTGRRNACRTSKKDFRDI